MKTIKKLFEEYEKAFSSLDVEKQVEFFTDSFISAGPKGSIAQGKKEFIESGNQASYFYKKHGFASAKIISLNEEKISENYILVKTHWKIIFNKNGEKIVEFDVSYIVHADMGKPKIIMFITHEDEAQFMQQLNAKN